MSQLKGAINEFWCFKATFVVDIKLRKWKSKLFYLNIFGRDHLKMHLDAEAKYWMDHKIGRRSGSISWANYAKNVAEFYRSRWNILPLAYSEKKCYLTTTYWICDCWLILYRKADRNVNNLTHYKRNILFRTKATVGWDTTNRP